MTGSVRDTSEAGPGTAPIEIARGDYVISTDRSRIDVAAVHAFLSRSYWSPGIPEDIVRRGIAGAICFGIYHGRAQVGFARVITDQATYARADDRGLIRAVSDLASRPTRPASRCRSSLSA